VSARWIPQAWPYIHPVQDVQGKTMEIQAGLSSRSRKVAEGGYDAACWRVIPAGGFSAPDRSARSIQRAQTGRHS
jgi:hypothetical protein